MNIPRNTQFNTAIASIGSQTQRPGLGVSPVQSVEDAPPPGEVIHLPSIATIDQSVFSERDANDFNQYYNKIFSTKTPGSAVYESIRQKTGSGNGEGGSGVVVVNFADLSGTTKGTFLSAEMMANMAAALNADYRHIDDM